MKKNSRERELDRLLEGGTGPADDETRALKQIADDLKGELDVPVPSAHRDRALFVSGVAARRVSPWRSSAISALAAGAAVVVALLLLGEGALPGQPLYNVSKALRLAEPQVKIVDRRIAEAQRLVNDAEEALDAGQIGRAEALAYNAMGRAWLAQGLLPQLDPAQREERSDAIHDVYDDAVDVLRDAGKARSDAAERGRETSDDNSGPGGGDDDSDDNSGSGGGGDDDSDDDSGSGGGGDDDSDDNSGSGGGGDDDSDDNSGSGSDDDKPDDD